MGIFDKFLSAVRINDDDYDDEEFYDEEDDIEANDTEAEPAKPKKSFFSRIAKKNNDDDLDDFDDDDDYEDEKPKAAAKPSAKQEAAAAPKASKPYSTKITPIRRKGGPMEVNVIKPTSMEDTREIADTLLSDATVVLNLEGIDVDMAQRVIDFASGACYAIDGSLQKVSSYIFILTPQNVEISGDITDILNGSVRS